MATNKLYDIPPIDPGVSGSIFEVKLGYTATKTIWILATADARYAVEEVAFQKRIGKEWNRLVKLPKKATKSTKDLKVRVFGPKGRCTLIFEIQETGEREACSIKIT